MNFQRLNRILIITWAGRGSSGFPSARAFSSEGEILAFRSQFGARARCAPRLACLAHHSRLAHGCLARAAAFRTPCMPRTLASHHSASVHASPACLRTSHPHTPRVRAIIRITPAWLRMPPAFRALLARASALLHAITRTPLARTPRYAAWCIRGGFGWECMVMEWMKWLGICMD